ncbi:MAG: hemolysin family protein [Deltaproteobacteria bacterium]
MSGVIPTAELMGAGVCVLLGSFVAGVEGAAMSLPDARLRALRDELGVRRGTHVSRYLDSPSKVLARLLAFRVSALILASILAANALLPGRAPWWDVLGLSLGISLIYGAVAELFTTIGRARGRSLIATGLTLTRPLELFIKPVAAPLVWLGQFVEKRTRLRNSDENTALITQREVEYVVEQAEHTGALDAKRGQMMQNVLELKDVTAKDVMVPRTKMHALEVSTDPEHALHLVTEEGHSRVPVFRGQVDNVVGVLHVKDLYRAVQNARGAGSDSADITIEALSRKPPFLVTASQSALTVLRDMQARRTHMAMVVDEFGSVIGLVTLEDILEELVGDIQDEHDTDDPPFVDYGDGRFLASAAIATSELGDHLGVEFPEAENYASLGGFLAERAGKIPSVGTVVNWNVFTFTVREGDARHATKVEILRTRRSAPPTRESPHPGGS